MTADFPTGAPQEPVACCDTAFSCLLRLGARSGAMMDVEAARRRSVVDEDTLPVSRLIELADEFGLKAEETQLDWQGLQVVGQRHPILVLLTDTNVAIVTAGERGEAKDIAVWDPLNRHGKILFVPREDFENAWTGHALIITNQAANTPATAASAAFCWYTSAGLELLGKAGTKGQLSNLPNRPQSVGENWRKPEQRRERRQSAVVSDMRGGPVSAPPETAEAHPSPVPLRIVQPASPEADRGADTGRLFGIGRLGLAAAGIAVVVGIVGLMLRGGAIDMVGAAVTRATESSVTPPRTALPTQAAAVPPAISPAISPAAPAENVETPNVSPAAMPPLAPAQVTAPAVAEPSVGRRPITTPAVAPAAGVPAGIPPAGIPPAGIPALDGSASRAAVTPPETVPSVTSAAPAAASDEVGPRTAAPPPPGPPPATAPSAAPAAPAATSDEVGPGAAAPRSGPPPTPAASGTTAAAAAASDEVGPRAAAPQPTAASSVATAAAAAASDEVGPRAAAAEPATEASSTATPAQAASSAPAASSPTAAASIPGSAAETPPDGAATAARRAATPPAGPQLSAAELATLLARGDALLSIGDIASARLFYERAANAGDALAALRLGETFDPGFLARAHLRAVQPDSRVAVSWYRRARDLGVADAEILLKSLESK